VGAPAGRMILGSAYGRGGVEALYGLPRRVSCTSCSRIRTSWVAAMIASGRQHCSAAATFLSSLASASLFHSDRSSPIGSASVSERIAVKRSISTLISGSGMSRKPWSCRAAAITPRSPAISPFASASICAWTRRLGIPDYIDSPFGPYPDNRAGHVR